MSRSGYSEDCDQWDLIRYRGMVASSIRGKRGQKFLKELLNALDSMPEKKLITDEIQNAEGQVCALGSLAKTKGIDTAKFHPDDLDENTLELAKEFDIAGCLAREVVYENDEGWYNETPEARWKRMRDWVAKQIKR